MRAAALSGHQPVAESARSGVEGKGNGGEEEEEEAQQQWQAAAAAAADGKAHGKAGGKGRRG